jgi:hypothetical protein
MQMATDERVDPPLRHLRLFFLDLLEQLLSSPCAAPLKSVEYHVNKRSLSIIVESTMAAGRTRVLWTFRQSSFDGSFSHVKEWGEFSGLQRSLEYVGCEFGEEADPMRS